LKKALLYWHLASIVVFVVIVICSLGGIRIIWQWQLGVMATVSFFLSAILGLAIFKTLSRGRKIYTGFITGYTVALIVTFFTETLAAIVLAIPFLFFILPDDQVAANKDYVIREAPTILGTRQYVLLENHALYEKRLNLSFRPDNETAKAIYKFDVLQIDDSLATVHIIYNTDADTTINFVK
jgi:hypothetical protein